MKNRAINALIEMGMPADISGFKYIVDAITLYTDEEWRYGKILALYYKIGMLNNTPATRVERAIRHAFSIVLTQGNLAIVKRYLTFEKTTNGNLLQVFYIRLQQESEEDR